ncbi:hypothetical protein E2542_SST02717 [Spatholobus suberectus]|nr:hypothetical protein E2542_SST02717 [Spatholobus suberectus]
MLCSRKIEAIIDWLQVGLKVSSNFQVVMLLRAGYTCQVPNITGVVLFHTVKYKRFSIRAVPKSNGKPESIDFPASAFNPKITLAPEPVSITHAIANLVPLNSRRVIVKFDFFRIASLVGSVLKTGLNRWIESKFRLDISSARYEPKSEFRAQASRAQLKNTKSLIPRSVAAAPCSGASVELLRRVAPSLHVALGPLPAAQHLVRPSLGRAPCTARSSTTQVPVAHLGLSVDYCCCCIAHRSSAVTRSSTHHPITSAN